jgi:hypothetical protein
VNATVTTTRTSALKQFHIYFRNSKNLRNVSHLRGRTTDVFSPSRSPNHMQHGLAVVGLLEAL